MLRPAVYPYDDRMGNKRLVPLGAGIAAVALGAVMMVSAPIAANAAPQTEGLQYVALGDSYAAGYGILPSTDLPVPGCDQGQQNYPHQIAAALGMQLTDVTCTGAVTANIIDTAQQTPSYFGGGTAAPQSAALSADTDVVTVSIGGNDAGFSAIAEACVADSASGPVLGVSTDPQGSSYATCEAAFAAAVPPIDLAANVDGVVRDNLRNAYAAIRAAAPNAKVFVVGYPAIFPDAANTPAAGCFTPLTGGGGILPNAVPFTPTDVAFIHGIEVLLNDAIADEAAAAGFTFVDNQPGSFAHSVCPQSGEPYVNGITLTFSEPFTAPGALHPNAAGVAYLAGATVPVISAAFPAGEPGGPVIPAPVPSSSASPLPVTAAAPALAESGGTAWPAASLLGAGLVVAGAVAVGVVRLRARRA
jgi:lysophospholipase L1-like esterase